jgi:hypothetical protein
MKLKPPPDAPTEMTLRLKEDKEDCHLVSPSIHILLIEHHVNPNRHTTKLNIYTDQNKSLQ